jgi:hypothetical protein
MTDDCYPMLESTAVRHRSRATLSRQPRQVRKEATVTGSCVCSGCPVPGFFRLVAHRISRYPTKFSTGVEKFGRLGKIVGRSAVATPNQLANVPAY